MLRSFFRSCRLIAFSLPLFLGCDSGTNGDKDGPPTLNTKHSQQFRQNNSSIVILSEKAGLEDLDLRPTRENIVRQFENLTQAGYEEDAQVVILFSGHGGRQRDTNGDEVDGLDEVFCPADVEWNSEENGVKEGGITDDEIHSWLDQISSIGAPLNKSNWR